MSSDTTRPEIARDVIEEVDATLRETTGVPVDELGFEAKVRALLDGYAHGSGDADGEPRVHPEVARRIQNLEAHLSDVADRVDEVEDDLAESNDGATKEEVIRQEMNARPPRRDENTGLDSLIDDTETRRY
jgi:hypothetical protein